MIGSDALGPTILDLFLSFLLSPTLAVLFLFLSFSFSFSLSFSLPFPTDIPFHNYIKLLTSPTMAIKSTETSIPLTDYFWVTVSSVELTLCPCI